MTLTKAHIVENLFAKNWFTKSGSAQIIKTLFQLIKQPLRRGDGVMISGFGEDEHGNLLLVYSGGFGAPSLTGAAPPAIGRPQQPLAGFRWQGH